MVGIVDLFTSGGVGAAIGLAGGIATRWQQLKMDQAKFKFDLDMANVRAKEFEAESKHELDMADKQVERAEVEGKIAVDVVNSESFKEGLKVQTIATGIKWVDAIRGLMRPLITVYMLGFATWLAVTVHLRVGGLDALPEQMISTLYMQVLDDVFFLTTTSVAWWFSSRPASTRK